MLANFELSEIQRLWKRKLEQDAEKLPNSLRHRNLEPVSAVFINSLCVAVNAKILLEIGGSSGISTIALASAAKSTEGKLISIEIEPQRQAEAKNNIRKLGLEPFVEFILGDAADIITKHGNIDFALIDCEKEDYIRFFDMLKLAQNSIVVADNIISHKLYNYTSHVQQKGKSITLSVGKGLEITLVGH